MVDDHALVRQGVAAVVDREPDMSVVGEAGTGEEAVERYRALVPDVTVMDLGLPEIDGVQGLDAAEVLGEPASGQRGRPLGRPRIGVGVYWSPQSSR